MRIAFAPAARLLSETQPNGEALIASTLLRAVAARGHQVLAYCERSELPAIDGVEVREVPVEGASVGLARLNWARAIARDLERERIDIAHVLFPFDTAGGYCFVRSAPVVAGPINLPWPHTPKLGGSGLARAFGALVGRRERRAHARTLEAAGALLVTGASARDALDQRLHERCHEVPFGVDVQRFLPRPLPAEPTIVFASAILQHKGIEVLIRAMPAVMRAIPRARLLVAGPDPAGMRADLERLASQLRVGPDVHFLGEVAPADMPALYARATVVCQPSFGEPFGMSVIEAMAAGRAVVGTDAGGIPDALVDGDGGRLVPVGDERMLADALSSILASPDAATAMGAFNRARAAERYDLSVIVDRLEHTWRALAITQEPAHVA